MIDINEITRRFVIQEGKVNGSLEDYIQGVIDQLELIRPASQTDARRLNVAKDNLKMIKRLARRLIQGEQEEK